MTYEAPTLRNIYKVLASQYDPLGYLLPYSTRAKLIILQLWDKQHGWDDSNLPSELMQAWSSWEGELECLSVLSLPRPYVFTGAKLEGAMYKVHVFTDASEQAYGAVAYLRTKDGDGQVHVSFILARSRVAPKRTVHPTPGTLCSPGSRTAHLSPREGTDPGSDPDGVVV